MAPPKIVLFLLGMLLAVAYSLLAVQPAAAEADGCADGFSTDFNGDGFSDTVVADPYATVGGRIPGRPSGRAVRRRGRAHRPGQPFRGQPGLGWRARRGRRRGTGSGYSIAVGDVDCDEFTDLVVGSPYEDVGTAVDSGYMQIVWGAVGGLGSGSPSRQFTQTSFGETVHGG